MSAQPVRYAILSPVRSRWGWQRVPGKRLPRYRRVRVGTVFRRTYPGKRGGYTFLRRMARSTLLTAGQVRAARKWHADTARAKHGPLRVLAVPLYPYVVVDADTKPARPSLMRKLNSLGRGLRRRLRGRELTRTHERQAELYAQNMNPATGRPYPGRPLTARPGTSNHEPPAGEKLGKAGDIGVLPQDTNVGAFPGARALMRRLGLCLPVPGEDWHVEEGSTWRA